MDRDYEPKDDESHNMNDEDDYNDEADNEGRNEEHDASDDNHDWAPQEEDSSDNNDVDPATDLPSNDLQSDEPEPEENTGVEPVENTGVETTHESTGVEPSEDNIEAMDEVEPSDGEPQKENDDEDEVHTSEAGETGQQYSLQQNRSRH